MAQKLILALIIANMLSGFWLWRLLYPRKPWKGLPSRKRYSLLWWRR